jgi:hypothetical protein
MVSTPQTVSIALGAALVTVVDYRLLVVAMAVVVTACAAYLLTRGPEPETVAAEPVTEVAA